MLTLQIRLKCHPFIYPDNIIGIKNVAINTGTTFVINISM
jgi:hypothetical protein